MAASAHKVRRREAMTRDQFAEIGAPEVGDLVAVTGWDAETIRLMIRSGNLPAIRVGGRWILNRRAALLLLDGESYGPDDTSEVGR